MWLDQKPQTWEDRLILYVGYLVNKQLKSGTIKSYISAIKAVLADDGIHLNEDKYLLTSLTQACRLVNDSVQTRLLLQLGMVNIILEKTEDMLMIERSQPYLASLYQAMFAAAYYGLLRISKVTKGSHPILAPDVHVADNKDNLIMVLQSSKTHGRDMKPQMIKIMGNRFQRQAKPNFHKTCPVYTNQQLY